MRFIWAIAALVVATTMIVLGIAQRTVWLAPASLSQSIVVKGDPRYIVMSGTVLAEHPGAQTFSISGEGTVYMAYGRDADVRDWLGADTHAVISIDEETGELTTKLESNAKLDPTISDTKPSDAQAGGAPAAESAPELKSDLIVNPAGSDLWLEEFSSSNRLDNTVNLPEGVSALIAADGEAPAPSRIQVSWPLDNATPWAGPLLAGGALFGLIGLLLLLWGLWGVRRGRGPQRNMPRGPRIPRITALPRRKAITASVGPAGAITYGSDGENEGASEGENEGDSGDSPSPAEIEGSTRSMRARIAVVPMLLVTGLALSGCSADLWPKILTEPNGFPASSAVPTPLATNAPAVEPLPATAVTVPQLQRIMRKIAVVTGDADAAADATLLATRFTGPAQAVREGNYAIRAIVPDFQMPDPIPASEITIALPQQTDSWPRTVFAVVQNPDDPTIPPTALQLTQETPRGNYLVEYAMRLEPDAETPKVAPSVIGATLVPPDNKLLVLSPSQIAAAYSDILTQGDASEFYPLFRAEGDTLRAQIGLEAQQEIIAALPTTATMTFSKTPGTDLPTPLATLESGAIVAVEITETEVITPSEAGATVSPSGSVKAISQVDATTKGIQTDYVTQILFYIPAAGSKEQIVLLGYAQGLISAVELS